MAPKSILRSSLALALCGLAGPAFAQDQPDPTSTPVPAPEEPVPAPTPSPSPDPTPAVPVVVVPPATPVTTDTNGAYAEGFHEGYAEGDSKAEEKHSPIAAVTLGGGVSTFTRQDVRDATGTAGNWDLRAAFGTGLPFAIEAAYTGSALSIDALGLDSDAILVGNGLEADLKFQLPLPVSPYAVIGAGWRNYQIVNTETNTSDIADEDNVLEVPIGVGIGFNGLGMSFDLRGTYRHAFEDDLMGGDRDEVGDNIDSSSGDLHRIGVNLGIGLSF
jgi:opacity protein-like surface antigen